MKRRVAKRQQGMALLVLLAAILLAGSWMLVSRLNAESGMISAVNRSRNAEVLIRARQALIGYVAQFLDGIWLRAPYLHNGSVPSLRDLLKPPSQRPQAFWRGYDVYDPANIGFIMQGPEAERAGTKYDTTLRGNGNMGHDFGTGLPEEDKNALVEYLKTL